MRQSIAIVSAIASMALAQASSIDFFFPGGYEGAIPVASVVKANPSTTVIDLVCPTGTDSTECGFGAGFRYSIISTTVYQASLTEEGFEMAFTCDHNLKKAEMTCGVSIGGVDANGPLQTTTVLSGNEIAFLTASVVAGGDLLAAETGATGSAGVAPKTTGTSSFAPATTSSSASTGFQTSGTATSTPPASGVSSSVPTSQFTGAAYRYGVEGPALLALAGAAALNMW